MKTFVLYTKNGEILVTRSGPEIEDDYYWIVSDIEENKEIISVDVETNTVITKDKDTRVQDIQTYLNSADDTTISKVEDTILEVEVNKISEGDV